MPNTQFDKITIDANHNIVASGPYEPGLTNVNDTDWHLIGTPVVVFMIVKNEPNTTGNPEAGNPDIVADGIGYMNTPSPGQPGSWKGSAAPSSANAQMAAGDTVRAVGAAIQVKNDRNDPQNPPTVEVVTWCVRQTITQA